MSKDEQQKRGGFVSVGDLALDLPGVPVPAPRAAAPQARHHFTQLDQVTQLVGASEADADVGFMARLGRCAVYRAATQATRKSTSGATARTP